jgi:hypothetical protein
MIHFHILLLALSLAFCQVEVIQFGSVKPFNCIKCMTGYYALALGCIEQGWHGLWYLPLGVFIGAIFQAIKMRWL